MSRFFAALFHASEFVCFETFLRDFSDLGRRRDFSLKVAGDVLPNALYGVGPHPMSVFVGNFDLLQFSSRYFPSPFQLVVYGTKAKAQRVVEIEVMKVKNSFDPGKQCTDFDLKQSHPSISYIERFRSCFRQMPALDTAGQIFAVFTHKIAVGAHDPAGHKFIAKLCF